MKSILDIGTGMGHRVMAGFMLNLDIYGFDVSEYAINHSSYKEILLDRLWIDNIIELKNTKNKQFDFIICYDILEHLFYQDLNKALNNIYNVGKPDSKFLFSIPWKGNPDLYNDKTHKIFESKEWWIEKIKNAGFKILPTPQHFLFKDQLIIAEK
ncbi:MAG: class I SAM-dependent methyltransferase [Nanoarchaeota archaeon]